MSEASAPVLEKSKAEAPKQTGAAETSSDQSTQQAFDTGKGKELAGRVRRFFKGTSGKPSVHEGMEGLAGKKPLEQTTGNEVVQAAIDITKDAADKDSGEQTQEGLRLSIAQVTDRGGEDALRSEAALMAHAKRGGSKEGPSIAPIAKDATKWEKTKHLAKEMPKVIAEGAKEAAKHPGKTLRKMWEGRVTRGAVHALQERNAAAMLVNAGIDTALSKPLMDAIQDQAQQNVTTQRGEQGRVEQAMMTVKDRLKIVTAQRKLLETEEIDIAGKLNEAISTPKDKQSPELKAFIDKHRSTDNGGTGLLDKYVEERSGSFAAKSALAESVSLADTVGEVELTGKAKETFAEALAPIVQQRLLDKGHTRTKEQQVRENVAVEQALLQTAYALPDGEVRQQILSSVSRASTISQGIDQLATEAEKAVSHVKGAAAVEGITQFITEMPSITLETAAVVDTSLAKVARSRYRVTEKAFQRLQEAQETPEFADALRTMDHAAARVGMLDSGLVESVAAAGAAMGMYAAEIGGRKAGRVFGAWVGGTGVAAAFGARRGIAEANLDIALKRTGEARGKELGQKGDELKNVVLPLADTKGTVRNVQQSLASLRTEGGDTQGKLQSALIGLAEVNARNRAGDSISERLWDGSQQDSRMLDRQKAELAVEVGKFAAAHPDAVRRIAEKAGIDVKGDAYVEAVTSQFADALEANIQRGIDLGEVLGGVLSDREVDRSISDVQRSARNLKAKQSAIETSKIAAFSAGMLGALEGGEAALDGAAEQATAVSSGGQAENLGNVSLAGAATEVKTGIAPEPESGGGESLPKIGEDPLKLLEQYRADIDHVKFENSPAEQQFHTVLRDNGQTVRLEMPAGEANVFAFEVNGQKFLVEGKNSDGKLYLDLNNSDSKINMIGKDGKPIEVLQKDLSAAVLNQKGLADYAPKIRDLLDKQGNGDIATEMHEGGKNIFNVDTISAVKYDSASKEATYYSSIHGGGVPKDVDIPGKNGVEIPQGADQKAIERVLTGGGFEHKGDVWVKDEITISDKQIAEHVKTIEQMQGLPNNVSPEFNAKGQLNLEREGKVIAENVTITDKGEITYELNGKTQSPLAPKEFIEKLKGKKVDAGVTGYPDESEGYPGSTDLQTVTIGGDESDIPKDSVIYKHIDQYKELFKDFPDKYPVVYDKTTDTLTLTDKNNPDVNLGEGVTITNDGKLHGNFRGEWDGKDFILEKKINNDIVTIPLEKLLPDDPNGDSNDWVTLGVLGSLVSVAGLGAISRWKSREVTPPPDNGGGEGADPDQDAEEVAAPSPAEEGTLPSSGTERRGASGLTMDEALALLQEGGIIRDRNGRVIRLGRRIGLDGEASDSDDPALQFFEGTIINPDRTEQPTHPLGLTALGREIFDGEASVYPANSPDTGSAQQESGGENPEQGKVRVAVTKETLKFAKTMIKIEPDGSEKKYTIEALHSEGDRHRIDVIDDAGNPWTFLSDLLPGNFVLEVVASPPDQKAGTGPESIAEVNPEPNPGNTGEGEREPVPESVEAYNKGKALVTEEEYGEAIKEYNEAIRLDGNNIDAYIGKGKALENLGKYEEAIKEYNEAIRLNPDNAAPAYSNKGWALWELGKPEEEVMAALDKAIELNSEYSDAYFNKGLILGKIGKKDEAKGMLDKAAELRKNE